MATNQDQKLERVLGFWAALSIGTGTMIGAGLFVFPGIAAGKAGPAATVSFAIGGAVALLVTASTAELATAMPHSGGPYYYVSQLFGPFAGFLVGTCQSAGLIFASAFYLVAFARYVSELLVHFDLSLGAPVALTASGSALLLTVVNLTGAKKAGRLQNSIVGALATITALLFGYGLLDVVGIIGPPRDAGPFAPSGVPAVFTTAALVFTSYLGFVQIATVAGEVKRPERNLPLALFTSVILVTTLYVTALFVSTRVVSSNELGRLGEEGTVEVAKRLIGSVGAATIMVAGALAALSSANASVLSASRTVFAMGEDGLTPELTARVHDRYNTPHVALWFVGAPLAALVFVERLELLTETASALHFVIYALVSLSLVAYRRRDAGDSRERFRLPAGRVIAACGMLACIGLLCFLSTKALLTTLAIASAAIVGYVLGVRRRTGFG